MPTSATNAIARWLRPVCVVAAVTAAGCQAPTIPNPNDPGDVGVVSAAVLRRNLAAASAFLNTRVDRGEITPAKAKQLLAGTADKLISHIDLKHIEVASAWEYGDVFRTAEQWDLAEGAYLIAVKHAVNEDRRINDTLRLAAAMAHRGKVAEAIQTAKAVLNAAPKDSAPILPGVLYEITPAARGKKHDGELAKLLEEAVKKHIATIVDPNTTPGRDFIRAKPHHVVTAYEAIVDLYRSAGDDKAAQKALERGIALVKKLPAAAPR